MFFLPILVLQLPLIRAFPQCSKQLKKSKDTTNEVFFSAEQANFFIGRHLLYNRFDFELVTKADLERECYEETCDYEEAREYFEDPGKTKSFWKDYVNRVPGAKINEQEMQKIDVMGLLTGLVAIGVLLVISGLLIYYLCQTRCKQRRLPRHPSSRGHNSSVIFQRHEEFSLNPLSPDTEQTGLPTYEQAVALTGHCDAPPPPYPGPSGKFKMFKKSISHPGP
uniref:Proline rich and Gla domain 4 n=1 Tax=Salvator merianae TaxID=96440 RepID=A0A8D0B1E1_SALMN